MGSSTATMKRVPGLSPVLLLLVPAALSYHGLHSNSFSTGRFQQSHSHGGRFSSSYADSFRNSFGRIPGNYKPVPWGQKTSFSGSTRSSFGGTSDSSLWREVVPAKLSSAPPQVARLRWPRFRPGLNSTMMT